MTDQLPNTLAFQHNEFIRNPLRMGDLEVKLFIHALAQVNQRDTVLPPISIPVRLIAGDKPSGKDYTNIWKACQDLAAQHINVLPVGKRGRRTLVNIISTLSLDPGTGLLTGKFNPDATPYLLKLKDVGNFTSAEIEKLLTFKNANSARLYWILLSYRNLESRAGIVKVQIELDELKSWMLTGKELYPVFADFKKRVLDPVAEDFAAIGFGATWEPVRTGAKTTALQFYIPANKPEPKALLAAARSSAAADTFSSWLATQTSQLQTAYHGLVSKDGNQLTPTVARRIIQHVAGNLEAEQVLFQTRYTIGNTTIPPTTTKAAYSVHTLKAALGMK
jgi:plasmid replication initiation protein